MILDLTGRFLRGLAAIIDPRAEDEALVEQLTDARREGRMDAYRHVAEWCRPRTEAASLIALPAVIAFCEKRIAAESGSQGGAS